MTPDQIKQVRKNLKMTQTAFASSLGLSENAIKQYEGGKRKISKTVHMLIACKYPNTIIAENL